MLSDVKLYSDIDEKCKCSQTYIETDSMPLEPHPNRLAR